MTENISDGKFTIRKGQGLSQAIAEELELNTEQCKKINWQSVFAKVKEAKDADGNKVNWGGGDTLTKTATGKNFVVHEGQEFEFSVENWKKIVDEVKNSLTEKNVNVDNLKAPQEESPVEEVKQPVEEVKQPAEEVKQPAEETQTESKKEPEFKFVKNVGDMLQNAEDNLNKFDKYKMNSIDKDKTKEETRYFGGIVVKYYDSNGNLVRETVTRKNGTVIEKLYNADGDKIAVIKKKGNEDPKVIRKNSSLGVNFAGEDSVGKYYEVNGDGTGESYRYYYETGEYRYASASPEGSKPRPVIYYNSDGNAVKCQERTLDEKDVLEYSNIQENCNVGSMLSWRVNDSGQREVEFEHDLDGKVTGSAEYEYDPKGNETKCVVKDADGEVAHSWESEYDKNGNCTKKVCKDADGKEAFSDEYMYDLEGNMIKRVRKDADGKEAFSDEFKYDLNGNQTETVCKDADGKVSSSYEFKYDEKGNQTEIVCKDANGNVEYSYEYTYDENGKLIVSRENTYDSNGELTEAVLKNADGDKIRSCEYKYDSNGNRTEAVVKNAGGDKIKSYEYKYDSKGNKTKEVWKDAKGAEITYDEWKELL